MEVDHRWNLVVKKIEKCAKDNYKRIPFPGHLYNKTFTLSARRCNRVCTSVISESVLFIVRSLVDPNDSDAGCRDCYLGTFKPQFTQVRPVHCEEMPFRLDDWTSFMQQPDYSHFFKIQLKMSVFYLFVKNQDSLGYSCLL